ncbi:MAG TPA: carbon-nitrogen hydrolase family protein [Acidimicrobiales bacterium]|nr:carbon-nitrogen hydrolase family protein [Acidimicrobiales bacterium]
MDAVDAVDKVTVAAVQAAPVFLDREATIDKACGLVDEAARQGASLVVFPESFVPAYPDWIWRLTPWELRAGALYARLLDQAVVVGERGTEALGEAALRNGCYVSIGVNEREPRGSTIFDTQLCFGPDGEIVSRHRKLTATGAESLVWGLGDGSALAGVDTPFGRLGGLTAWENYLPLARAALYAQAIDVYLAPTWDSSDVWTSSLRHIAKEGRVYVIGVNSCVRVSDIPSDVPFRDEIYGDGDGWLATGNSAIVGPEGELLAGPVAEQERILYAEIDPEAARASRHQFDSVGHSARPDVLRLHVNFASRSPVRFTGDPGDQA